MPNNFNITVPTRQHFSFEAIKNQLNPLYAVELVAAVEKLMSTKAKTVSAKQIVDSGICAVIKKHTHLDVGIDVMRNIPINACAFVPELDENHPLVNKFFAGDVGASDVIGRMRKSTQVLEGWVDIERGTVHGVFEEIPCKIKIGWGLLQKGSRFNARKTAAIIAHEIGHLITFFELVTRATKTNIVLQAAVQGFMETQDRKERAKFIAETEKQLGGTIHTREALLDSKDKTYITNVFMGSFSGVAYSDLGTDVYDTNMIEAVADNYAQRVGLGPELVEALAEIHRWSPKRLWLPFYLIWELIKFQVWLNNLLWGGIGGIIFALTVLLNNPHAQMYDEPHVRIKRIRDDFVNGAKDPELTKEEAKQLISSIASMDKVLKEIHDRPTLNQFVWKTFYPWGRQDESNKRFIKSLERLGNNDFYVQYAKMRSF